MLKAVLLLTGLVFAMAVVAPGLLTRATQTGAPDKAEQPVLANAQPDHGDPAGPDEGSSGDPRPA